MSKATLEDKIMELPVCCKHTVLVDTLLDAIRDTIPITTDNSGKILAFFYAILHPANTGDNRRTRKDSLLMTQKYSRVNFKKSICNN